MSTGRVSDSTVAECVRLGVTCVCVCERERDLLPFELKCMMVDEVLIVGNCLRQLTGESVLRRVNFQGLICVLPFPDIKVVSHLPRVCQRKSPCCSLTLKESAGVM